MARFTRVTTIAHNPVEPGAKWIERTRDALAAHLQEAARGKPDLVVFPETLNCTGLPLEEWVGMAETIPGPTFDLIAELAAEHATCVCLPLLEQQEGCLRNTAAFIDRGGNLLGKYHKNMPTIIEMELGVLPGTEAPAFEADFGRVGAAICFDLNYPDVGARLAASGARLVCFVSQYIGGDRLLHWARDYGFYLVTADVGRSHVVDMAGRYLGETGWKDDQVLCRYLPPMFSTVINMDRMLFHLAGNQDKFPEILRKYGPGVEIESHYPEAHFTMASLMQDVTVEDLVAEFELEPWVDYIDRCRGLREEYLR